MGLQVDVVTTPGDTESKLVSMLDSQLPCLSIEDVVEVIREGLCLKKLCNGNSLFCHLV